VAVGLERAHAEFLGQGKGLAVVGLGLAVLWWLTLSRNLTEETQGIGFVALFLVLTGERQHALGEGVRLLDAALQQIRFTQREAKKTRSISRSLSRIKSGRGAVYFLSGAGHIACKDVGL
jgi:hypothetical protein